jgi:FAD:protein FMN transferase
MKRATILLLLLAIVATVAGVRLRGASQEPVVQSRILMGTVVEITAFGSERRGTAEAVNAAFAEMARIEALMGPGEQSDAVRISRASDSVEISPETAQVLALGLEVATLSQGAFDLTLAPLKELWGIESESPRIPSEEEIRKALEGTGPNALRLVEATVIKSNPGVAIDLGGIAKGYAVDRAVEILQDSGIASAAVNAGGDMRLLGARPDRPWRIGIQDPRRAGSVLGTLEVHDIAVVTSGDYERAFEQNGVRYHHLFDPGTGHPARRAMSVTVVAQSAVLADALATALFVLGPEEGLALLAQFPETEALVVGADGELHLSAGLEGNVIWP